MAFQEELLAVIQAMPDVIVMFWDVHEGWNIVNGNYMLLSGKKPVSNALEELFEYVDEKDKATYSVFLRKVLSGIKGSENFKPIKEDRVSVSIHMGAQGDIATYHKVECFLMKDESGAVIRMNVVVCALDAEEIYRLQLAQTVTNDRTPAMLLRVADEIIKKNPEKDYAFIQFDVARFKAINEMYGEAFGDEMLNYFIESLKILCNQDQVFVRLTADVFMIMTSYESQQDLLDLVEMLNNNLLGYKDITYRLVFGVAYIEDVNDSLRKFGDRAALARQSIKGNVLTHVKFFEEGMKKSVLNSKYVEDHMEKALEDGEFVMYLQPKYRIPNGEMVGAEALTRWIRPDVGMISPADFVPVFERNGFIAKMDAYIWEEACKTIRDWIDSGIRPLPISVNVSRVHLRDNHFVDVLNYLTEKYNIDKKYLEIEITETYDEKGLCEGITLLKENGFTLLMDDFGCGYSSLNTLKDTQFDVIKIDRGFLQDFIGSDRGQKIVEHTIQMTKAIGLDMVAEGVESKEQATFLMNCGCDIAQGFYYARPMDLESFNQLMNE